MDVLAMKVLDEVVKSVNAREVVVPTVVKVATVELRNTLMQTSPRGVKTLSLNLTNMVMEQVLKVVVVPQARHL